MWIARQGGRMMKRGGNSAFIASGARTVDAWTQVVVGGRAWVAGTGERALWQWDSACVGAGALMRGCVGASARRAVGARRLACAWHCARP